MPRVLVISYLFPPAGSVGVQRTLRFVKHLPGFGWEPVVLTASNARVDSLQPALSAKVPPGLEVHRSPSFESLNRGLSIADGRRGEPEVGAAKRLWHASSDLWRAIAVPDEKAGWVRSAVRYGSRLMSERPADAIYVTGKPFSSYLIGERLSRRFGVPWVMDLRDLWTLNRRMPPRNAWHGWRSRILEGRLVRSASAVIVNTPGNRVDFIAAYPDVSPGRFVTITNGFDADDFRGLPTDKFDRFTVSYTGTFYGQRSADRGAAAYETHSPRYLFEALAALLRDRPGLRGRVAVKIAGPQCEYARGFAERTGLGDVVELLGILGHRECLELSARSHSQWLVCGGDEASAGWVPCKLYQYLAVGTPILGLLPEGDAAGIVRRTGTGRVVAPDDVPAVRHALEEAIDGWNRGSVVGYAPVAEEIAGYEGRRLTARLAAVLDGIAGRPAAGEPEPETCISREEETCSPRT